MCDINSLFVVPDVLRVDFGLYEDPGFVLELTPLQPRHLDARGHEQLVLVQSLGRRDGALEQNL